MFGMAFMNKTYQQVTRSHEYPYLYEPVKTKDNVIINKEITVFGRYRLCGGIIMGIKNIVMYRTRELPGRSDMRYWLLVHMVVGDAWTASGVRV